MKLRWWMVGYFIAMALVLLSPLASPSPDGLERVAEDKGFSNRAQGAPFSLIADYLVPGIQNTAMATILAGWIGVTIVFGVAFGLAVLLRRRSTPRSPERA
ncbi:MAG: PDGLE domain-containing protein [Chloroflexota bacterium]